MAVNTGAINSVNRAVFDVLVKAAIASAVAAAPILADPVLNYIFTHVVRYFADKFFVIADRFIVFSAIGFDNELHDSQYQKALGELRAILKNPDASEKEIQNVSDKFDKSLGELVRMSKSS